MAVPAITSRDCNWSGSAILTAPSVNIARPCKQEKSFPLANGNLGLLYAQKGMNDEASVELARGLSSRPNPKYHKALARILAERKTVSPGNLPLQ